MRESSSGEEEEAGQAQTQKAEGDQATARGSAPPFAMRCT